MNYIFNSRSRNSNLMIRSATLWIHLVESLSTTVDKKPNHSNSDLHLYKKYISATENGYSMTRQLFHSERLKAAAGWHKVTVTGTVKEWFSLHVDHDLGLDVEMKGKNGYLSASDWPLYPVSGKSVFCYCMVYS